MTENGVFDKGERVLIVTRRMFAEDWRKHFVGLIDRVCPNAIRVRGYAFLYDDEKGAFVRRPSQRVRVFPLDSTIMLYVLPDGVEVEEVRYEHTKKGALVVTDGKLFKIDISEFGR